MTLFALSFSAVLAAQTVSIKDNASLQPIEKAYVYYKPSTAGTTIAGVYSNVRGEATLSGTPTDSIVVLHASYGRQAFLSTAVATANNQILMTPRSLMLNEVVFSVNKTEEKQAEVPYAMTVIGARDVAALNPQTSADMLSNSGQVFVQKSQMGGGSPVLRGFESSRVLLVVDGVRMNNAIYRAGHLQDVITIDPNMLDRTEVLFGPSSVMYGSDALGGAMLFYSRQPKLSTTDKVSLNAGAYLRFSSANNEQTGHLDFNIGGKRWASLTSFTRSSFGDLRQGARGIPYQGDFGWCKNYVMTDANGKDSMYVNEDQLVQKFTGYSQIDVMQKFLFQPNDRVSHLVNIQYSTSSDVPRYDRLQQYSGNTLRFAEWYYGPQNRLLASYTLGLNASERKLYNTARFIVAAQKIDQDRISRRFNNKKRTRQEEDVMVYSFNGDLKKIINAKNDLYYGVELTYNDVTSTATKTHIQTGVEEKSDTRYPDGGSSMTTAALYVTHSFRINDKLMLSEGLRMSYVQLKSSFVDTTFFAFPFTDIAQTHLAPSGTIGLVWNACSIFRVHGNISTAFRAPNVDDLTKVFESVAGTLIVPNEDIKPEMTIGGELGGALTLNGGARLEANWFYTSLRNAMVVRPFTYNGSDSIVYDGSPSAVVAMQNVDNAFIYGYNLLFSADFNDHFGFRATYNYTYGRYNDTKNDTLLPLDHIPPVFGMGELVYRAKKIESAVYVRYNGWKRIADYSPSGEDNLSQATAYGMPAWATVNFRASYRVNKNFGINAAVENITDRNYRHFASGVSAPGRNFIVTLRGNF